jgi:hypothetical protein
MREDRHRPVSGPLFVKKPDLVSWPKPGHFAQMMMLAAFETQPWPAGQAFLDEEMVRCQAPL